ncbi:MAG: DNA polymerase III subunit gamma/tau [bacterium]
MSYLVLARKYRPQTFSDVLGQEHITRTLISSIENDRLGHAFLFSGPRGIGKTTTARLLAKAVNCAEPQGAEPCNECDSCKQISRGNDVDVMEIDGASNNSVDQIRTLRENVQYTPAHSNMKIYIIDEVHMLSRSAFNALLKTLEEPPEHVIFIFATTEIDQVPDTIRSRCQRFDFRLIPQKTIVNCLSDICRQEEIPVEKEALFLIAKFAEGSLRDAQSILDQMINFTGAGDEKITQQLVSDTWGLAPYDRLLEFIEAIANHDSSTIISAVRDHIDAGNDIMALIGDLAEMLRNCLLVKKETAREYLIESLPEHLISQLKQTAGNFSETELIWMFRQLLDLHRKLQIHSRFRLQLVEVELIRIIEGRPRYNLAEIIDRLEKIENNPASAAAYNPEEESKKKSSPPVKNNKTEPKSSDNKKEVLKRAKKQNSQSPQKREPQPENRESMPQPATEPETIWSEVLEAVPVQTRAYLRNYSRVEEKDGSVFFWFEPHWRNHVQQLNNDSHLNYLKDAIEEKTGKKPDVKLLIDKEDSKPQPQKENKENRLLDQAKDIFQVDSVTKIKR